MSELARLREEERTWLRARARAERAVKEARKRGPGTYDRELLSQALSTLEQAERVLAAITGQLKPGQAVRLPRRRGAVVSGEVAAVNAHAIDVAVGGALPERVAVVDGQNRRRRRRRGVDRARGRVGHRVVRRE